MKRVRIDFRSFLDRVLTCNPSGPGSLRATPGVGSILCRCLRRCSNGGEERGLYQYGSDSEGARHDHKNDDYDIQTPETTRAADRGRVYMKIVYDLRTVVQGKELYPTRKAWLLFVLQHY